MEGTGPGLDDPVVDLRSDTVTRPTAGMREAIATAVVGDDMLGDDPTVQALEVHVAELLGKARALFFPSGTMANQTALAVLGRPGTGVLVESRTHIVHREGGGSAIMSGLQLRPVDTPDGVLTPELVRATLNPPARDLLQDSVIAIENTHMEGGGLPVPAPILPALREIADSRGLRIHMDGARLWNASTATGTDLAQLAEHADTVMVSLSKGLGAPVGSILAGTRKDLDTAWHVRRRLGGGMRQAGILAAAGLYALEYHRAGLAKDHAMAHLLAEGVAAVSGIEAVLPETNIVFVEIRRAGLDADSLLKFLKNRRILMSKYGPHRLRAVTHLDVDQQGIARTLAALADAVGET